MFFWINNHKWFVLLVVIVWIVLIGFVVRWDDTHGSGNWGDM